MALTIASHPSQSFSAEDVTVLTVTVAVCDSLVVEVNAVRESRRMVWTNVVLYARAPDYSLALLASHQSVDADILQRVVGVVFGGRPLDRLVDLIVAASTDRWWSVLADHLYASAHRPPVRAPVKPLVSC